MKKGLLNLLTLIPFSLFFAQHLFGLSYVESSSGLTPPTLDGGRTEVEMADINGDGNIDLLSIGDHGSPFINTDQHGIMVWFGDGNGSWSVYMNGNFGYGGIAVGDVNNDGLLDVGYGMHHNYSGNDFGDQLIEVALGDGTGQNWQPWDDSLAMEGQDWGMFGTDFADFNNDGLLDICSNAFGFDDGIHAYINNGDGTWHRTFGFIGGNSRMDIVFGDVNNDGNGDFAVGHQGGTVYIGDGNGNFTVGDGNLPPGGSLGLSGVSLRDINNDGGDEIAFCNSNGGVEVWSWVSANTWVSLSGSLPTSGPYDAAQLFDMNVDEYCDIVAFGSGTVTIWTGDGAGNWTEETSFTTPSPGYFEAFRVGGDADHNGFPDIVLVADEGSWPSYRNHIRFFKETSIPETLSIHSIYPHGYEKFYAGSVHFIDWISSVPDTQPTSVMLELSTTGNSGPWVTIADNLPDNGKYQWLIPDTISSQDCFFRYTIFDQSDTAECITPAPFEIMPSLSIYQNPPTEIMSKNDLKIIPSFIAHGGVQIYYEINKTSTVNLSIYDSSGRVVKKLIDRKQKRGHGNVLWDGKDEMGFYVKNGIYFILLTIEKETISKKIALMK